MFPLDPPYAPVYIYEIPMGTISSQLGQGPVVSITLALAASADPYILSELTVPAGVDVTVQIWGAGGGGGGATTTGPAGGGGGGGPAGVLFRVPAAQWAADGTLTLPLGGAGSTTNTNGVTGAVAEFEIGSNLVQVGGGTGGTSVSGMGGAGGTVIFTAPDFQLAGSRNGSAGGARFGIIGGPGGTNVWGGDGGMGGSNGFPQGANGSDSRAIIQFTPGA